MDNDNRLVRELRRHNLLKSLLERQIVAEAVEEEVPDQDVLKRARDVYMQSNGIKDDEGLNESLKTLGWDKETLEWQLSLPFRISQHCRKNYRAKAESRFLERKNQLDKIVYSLIRTKDAFLAQEIYLRIEEGEESFGELAGRFSEGPEKTTKGVVGPVSMTQAHPIVAEKLRTTKPGVIIPPLMVADWWLVMRLESYSPASFDEAMADRLSRELFDQWVKIELERRIIRYSSYNEPTAYK